MLRRQLSDLDVLDQQYNSKRIRLDDLLEAPTHIDLTVTIPEKPLSLLSVDAKHETRPNQSDICLGLLDGGIVRPAVAIRNRLHAEQQLVRLKAYTGGILVYAVPGDDYIGLVSSDVGVNLSEVILHQPIRTEAFLKNPSARADKRVTAERLLEVIVYASEDDAHGIGDALAQVGLFLQHPKQVKNASVKYFNPQYYVAKDELFPTLDSLQMGLSDLDDSVNGIAPSSTKETAKTLFSFAQGPQNWTHHTQSPRILTPLKEHQLKALAMMIEKERGLLEKPEFVSLWKQISRISQTQVTYRNIVNGTTKENPHVSLGGLLADDMGLGKTLSTISLIAASMDSRDDSTESQDTEVDESIETLGLSKTLIVAPKATLSSWETEFNHHVQPNAIKICLYSGRSREKLTRTMRTSDVILTTYGILEKEATQSRSSSENISPLFATQWLRVIFDEEFLGSSTHVLRNNETKVFQAAESLRAERVWCLTGTPIQNYIEDLGSLLQILRVTPFDNPANFAFEFGQLQKSRDERILLKMQHLVSAIGLRRTKEILPLPVKSEKIEFVRLRPEERKLYEDFCSRLKTSLDEILATDLKPNSYANVMKHILRLRQICNHGADLLPEQLVSLMQRNLPIHGENAIDCEICGAQVNNDWPEFDCMHLVCKSCYVRSQREQPEIAGSCPLCTSKLDESNLVSAKVKPETTQLNRNLHGLEPSSKVSQLLRNLHDERHHDKSNLPPKSIDLRAATRAHLLEPQWNPMVEEQAFDRIHRIGQDHPVTVIRYIVENSIEQYVRQIQQQKLELIRASLDAHRSTKKSNAKEKLYELKEFFQTQSAPKKSKNPMALGNLLS